MIKPETVSLCVIAYNEGNYIGSLLECLKNQTWPRSLTEIILVDGRSEDGTKRIMEDFARENSDRYLRIRVLDNPKRIQAAGWNIAIAEAACDVLIRIDAHAYIPADFTERNMRLQQEGERITGGRRPCISKDRSGRGRVLLMIENSLFGSSIGEGRREGEKRYVKSLFHAAYRREVFAEAGVFNEGLLRTEDNEMHYRLRQKDCRFCFSPDIVSYQYVRCGLKEMIRQKYANGYWIGTTLKVCPGCLSIYHLVPAGFLCLIVLTAVLAAFGIWIPLAALMLLYAAFAVINTVLGARKTGPTPYLFAAPFIFLILHISYGAGTAAGLFAGKPYGGGKTEK